MKKHFLLLVMALMSMTAWAQTNIKDFPTRFNAVQFGTPVATTDLNVYDEGISSSTPLSYPSDLTWDGKVYSDADCTTEVTFPYAVGSYFVKVVGSGTKYNGEIKKPINIVQKTIYVALNWNNGTADVTAPLTKTFGDADPEWTLNWDKTAFVAPDTKAKVSTIFSGTAKLKAHSENVAYTTDATPTVTGVDIELEGLTSTNYIVKLDPAYKESSSSTTTLDFTKMLINPKTLSATDNPAAGLVYTATYQAKQVEPKFTIKDGKTVLSEKAVSGTTVTGDYEVTYSSATGINASTTPYTVTITGIKNYTGTLSGQVTINKAPLSVLVKDIKVPYTGKEYSVVTSGTDAGKITRDALSSSETAPLYAPEFVYSGYVGDDLAKSMATATASSYVPTIAPTVAITLATGEKALNVKEGNYPLEVTIPSGCTLENYAISALNGTAVSGKLIIEPYKLTVTARSTTQNYGENEKEIKYDLNNSGYVLQPAVAATASTPAIPAEKEFTTEPVFQKGGEGITPGDYPITLKSEGVTSSNFVVEKYVVTEYNEDGKTFKTGTHLYTINKATVTVVVLPHEKTYGEADPASLTNPVAGVDYVVTGVEDTSVLTGVVLTKDSESEDAGVYALTADFSALGDAFAVTKTPGTFTIKQKELKVTAQAQTLATNSTVAALNQNLCTVEGLVEGDAADKVFALTFDTDASGAAVAVDGEGKLTTATTYNNGIIATLLTDKTKKELGGNYKWADKNPVAGKLIVVNAAGTVILNRVAKDDYADETKNDAAAEIAKAAKADKDGDKKIDKFNATFSDFEMIAQKWYPIVLPFETSVAEISSLFNYAVVNVLNEENTDKTKISFKLHMGKIAANTPFVVKVYGADDKADNKVNMNTITFTSKTFIAPADYEAVTVEDASGVKFIGTYKGKIDGFRANEYYFSASASLNEYYKGNDTNKTYLRPLGAYFQVPATSAARVIEFEEADGTVTAISAVAFENDITSAEGWYTIGGMKLQGAPTQKGIYIQNGKKVIVK